MRENPDCVSELLLAEKPEKGTGNEEMNFRQAEALSVAFRIKELVVLKQRYGPCGEDVAVRLDYYPKFNYFCESDGKRAKKSERQTPGLSEAQRRKKRQNEMRLIGKVLDSYQRMGYIEGYEKYGEEAGIEITGAIADPNELLFEAEIEENSDL